MTPLPPTLRAAVDAALRAADQTAHPTAAFTYLERAHGLGQGSTREHVRVHMRMLAWAVHQRDAREVRGQLLRIAGAATKTALGWVPTGNTGGANVSPFKRMPVPPDLQHTMERVGRRAH